MVPGWPYSVVAALEAGRTSWTALLDALRLPPGADVTDLTGYSDPRGGGAADRRRSVGRGRPSGHGGA